jgi:hypothetical protein
MRNVRLVAWSYLSWWKWSWEVWGLAKPVKLLYTHSQITLWNSMWWRLRDTWTKWLLHNNGTEVRIHTSSCRPTEHRPKRPKAWRPPSCCSDVNLACHVACCSHLHRTRNSPDPIIIQTGRAAAWHTPLYRSPAEVGQWPDKRVLWQADQLNRFQECDRFCLYSPTCERGKSLKKQAR